MQVFFELFGKLFIVAGLVLWLGQDIVLDLLLVLFLPFMGFFGIDKRLLPCW